MNIQIGADPEFFVQRYRHFISPHGFPLGTKENPLKTEHGAVQVDGMALEINIKPASTRDAFIQNMTDARTDLEKLVYDYDPRVRVVVRPSVFFGRRRLSQLPPFATRLGCEPDWDAWTMQRNDPPIQTMPFRTGAGHLHISWAEGLPTNSREHINVCARIARDLDYTLGLPSLLWDKDNRRRTLYGKAGAFRPKPYGIEYRVLSNAWCSTQKHIGWVFDTAYKTVENLLANPHYTEYTKRFGNSARQFINYNDPSWVEQHPILREELLR